jgi:hypothetical protein
MLFLCFSYFLKCPWISSQFAPSQSGAFSTSGFSAFRV